MAKGKKTGGRTKGTPNKVNKDLIERIQEAPIDPFQVLMDLLQDNNPALRLAAAKELAQYIYPKRKAIEHSNPDGEGFKIVIEDYSSKKNEGN